MHVAAWYRGTPPHTKVHEIRGISVNGPDPKPFQFSPCSDKRCARYLLSKIHAPGKVGQSSQKSLKICYASMPSIVPNFITLDQTNFLHLQYFGVPGGPSRPKFTNLGSALMYSKGCRTNLPNFIPFWQPVYKTSAAELRGFCWKRDRQTKTVNNMSAHVMCQQHWEWNIFIISDIFIACIPYA